MANLLKVLYEVVWMKESVPRIWRQGLIGELFKYGGKGMANLLKVLYEVV